MSDPEKAARIFNVLSSETRVRIIDKLKSRTLCVNAMASALEISPAAVSQHLRILRDVDIVTAEKRGQYLHYRVNQNTLNQWRRTADELLAPDPDTEFMISGD